MMYVEIEQHINDDGTPIDAGEEKLSLLLPGHVQSRDNEDKDETNDAMVFPPNPPHFRPFFLCKVNPSKKALTATHEMLAGAG
eukprot:2775030-Rhodomonas_salina.1